MKRFHRRMFEFWHDVLMAVPPWRWLEDLIDHPKDYHWEKAEMWEDDEL